MNLYSKLTEFKNVILMNKKIQIIHLFLLIFSFYMMLASARQYYMGDIDALFEGIIETLIIVVFFSFLSCSIVFFATKNKQEK